VLTVDHLRETEVGIVGNFNGMFLVIGGHQDKDGTEYFFYKARIARKEEHITLTSLFDLVFP